MRDLFDLLNGQVSPGRWWPADTPFEIIVGAVLTQNTTWTNVERAIDNLRSAGALGPRALLDLSKDRLRELIRPAGFYNAKASYLRAAAHWFLSNDDAHGLPTDVLRGELLSVRGVGPETADDILLYVYDRPVFIYDLYARRLLKAAGFGHFQTYERAKHTLDPIVTDAKFSVKELARFHGLIVDAGKIARKLGGWDEAYQRLESGTFGVEENKEIGGRLARPETT